jgi:hypothetical protein
MSAALMPVFSGWDGGMIAERATGGKVCRFAGAGNALTLSCRVHPDEERLLRLGWPCSA